MVVHASVARHQGSRHPRSHRHKKRHLHHDCAARHRWRLARAPPPRARDAPRHDQHTDSAARRFAGIWRPSTTPRSGLPSPKRATRRRAGPGGYPPPPVKRPGPSRSRSRVPTRRGAGSRGRPEDAACRCEAAARIGRQTASVRELKRRRRQTDIPASAPAERYEYSVKRHVPSTETGSVATSCAADDMTADGATVALNRRRAAARRPRPWRSGDSHRRCPGRSIEPPTPRPLGTTPVGPPPGECFANDRRIGPPAARYLTDPAEDVRQRPETTGEQGRCPSGGIRHCPEATGLP